MKEDKITINLPNGDKLVAEAFIVGDNNQIAIGIMHDDVWIQDLALVENKVDDNYKYVENKYNVYVYGDEFSEDYSEKIEICRVPDELL